MPIPTSSTHTPDLLCNDLEKIGYTVDRVATFPEVPARIVEVALTNGVRVRFDRHAATIHVIGPNGIREHVRAGLSVLYEGSWPSRFLVCSPGIAMAAAFVAIVAFVGWVL
jgi:hypothetical protein